MQEIYYFIVWRGDENNDWRSIKFQINTLAINPFVIDNDGDRDLIIADLLGDLVIAIRFKKSVETRINDNGTYFGAVYRRNNYSEPPKPIIDYQTWQITDWNLGNNKNNINNNDNSEIEVTVKNKDVSENPIYQLEENYFNWLSITNELETNNTPPIPTKIKLSGGEYGKYLTNLIIFNEKIEQYLNYFSQWYKLIYSKANWMIMTKNLVEDNIKIIFYKHEKLFNFN